MKGGDIPTRFRKRRGAQRVGARLDSVDPHRRLIFMNSIRNVIGVALDSRIE